MAVGKVLITGSCGLVGSEAVKYFCSTGQSVVGVDNNQRGRLFGKGGSVSGSLVELSELSRYNHHNFSIINKMAVDKLVSLVRPSLIIHAAAQPSHDKSGEVPFEDFMINAVGTMNLLEAARVHCPESPFVFVSTNKVYGDAPNKLPMRESDSRYDFASNESGVGEWMGIDQSMHSPFGVSKAAADLAVQEYGRYYGMPTCCFRCGCVTGSSHRGVEQHGFLSHLCKTAKSGGTYTVYGHGGKQVRDNIHASDLVAAFNAFSDNPRSAEVYNMGGGRENSCSVIEALDRADRAGFVAKREYGDTRKGDHICYYSDTGKFRSHYPSWSPTRSLDDIFSELLSPE